MIRLAGLLLVLLTVNHNSYTQSVSNEDINIEITQVIFDDTENNITYSIVNEKFIVYKTRNITKSKTMKIAIHKKILDQSLITQLTDTINAIGSKQFSKMYTDQEDTKFVLTFNIATTEVTIYSMLENYYISEFDNLLKLLNSWVPEEVKKIDFNKLPVQKEK